MEVVWKLLKMGRYHDVPREIEMFSQLCRFFGEEFIFTQSELCLQREDMFSEELDGRWIPEGDTRWGILGCLPGEEVTQM